MYVGNLSFYTTELQIEEVFSTVGPVKRVIMGLNMKTKTPCGFCFVEYYTPEVASAALKFITGACVDDRVIRCDKDTGFKPGRQYGRGISGGQVRDEKRQVTDANRGGLSKNAGFKRGRDGKNQRRDSGDKRGSGGNKDSFGRDVQGELEDREASMADSMHKMDQGLSSSRAEPQAPKVDAAEAGAADDMDGPGEVEDAVPLDAADPRTMEDDRDDADMEVNPSKRTRR